MTNLLPNTNIAIETLTYREIQTILRFCRNEVSAAVPVKLNAKRADLEAALITICDTLPRTLAIFVLPELGYEMIDGYQGNDPAIECQMTAEDYIDEEVFINDEAYYSELENTIEVNHIPTNHPLACQILCNEVDYTVEHSKELLRALLVAVCQGNDPAIECQMTAEDYIDDEAYYQEPDTIVLETIKQLDIEGDKDNYVPVYQLRDKLSNWTRGALDKALYNLQRQDKLDMDSLVKATDYTEEQYNAGIPNSSIGPLFFLTVL